MTFDVTRLLLAAQIGLLDHVTFQLRAATVWAEPAKDLMIFHFYYDGEIDGQLFDLASCFTVESDPGFEFGSYHINEDIVQRIDFPNKIPIAGRLVYLRKELGCEQYLTKKYEFDHDLVMVRLLLYVQQALLGKVTENLRMLSVQIDEKINSIDLFFVFDGIVSESDQINADAICSESLKSFQGFNKKKHLLRIDYPNDIRPYGKRIVYSRYEDTPKHPNVTD